MDIFTNDKDFETECIRLHQKELIEIKEIVEKKKVRGPDINYEYYKGDLVVLKSTGNYENMTIRTKNKILQKTFESQSC
jgi:hypothetical protein